MFAGSAGVAFRDGRDPTSPHGSSPSRRAIAPGQTIPAPSRPRKPSPPAGWRAASEALQAYAAKDPNWWTTHPCAAHWRYTRQIYSPNFAEDVSKRLDEDTIRKWLAVLQSRGNSSGS